MNSLRERIAADFDLSTADPAWLELLEVACQTADLIAQLEALIASDGLLSSGSTGQVIVHPAVQELRQQRASYARLLAQLEIQDEETFRQRQSRYSRKRWTK